ncbi:hypothetical protein FGO68_gene12554 [Halteria grandinella]|uniref:Anaphase-promoting complex subunit 4-like WD40 domain-containing protein n=1 Tax=Halteria grandinella TaxID=5974 RepID=A0A8J8P2F0_HALGN|nr:hypothetical protein FGO68_gene12554 [Halteria grandinella]
MLHRRPTLSGRGHYTQPLFTLASPLTQGGDSLDEKAFIRTLAVSHRYTLETAQSNVLQCKFSEDGQMLAVSYADGTVMVHDAMSGEAGAQVQESFMRSKRSPKKLMTAHDLPQIVTCLSWRPTSSSKARVLKACGGDGRLLHYTFDKAGALTTSQALFKSDFNQYQSLDYSPCGERFVVGGKLPVVEVYDEETGKRVLEFKRIEGHTSKIFCCKFDSEDENLIYSGGWDRHVILWDLRAGSRVASLSGPLICGDALDTRAPFQLLTGSHTKTDSIQLWDSRTFSDETKRTIPWSSDSTISLVYSARFLKPSKCMVLACGVSQSTACILSTSQQSDSPSPVYDFIANNTQLQGRTIVASDATDQVCAFGSVSGQVVVSNLIKFDKVSMLNGSHKSNSLRDVFQGAKQGGAGCEGDLPSHDLLNQK